MTAPLTNLVISVTGEDGWIDLHIVTVLLTNPVISIKGEGGWIDLHIVSPID